LAIFCVGVLILQLKSALCTSGLLFELWVQWSYNWRQWQRNSFWNRND